MTSKWTLQEKPWLKFYEKGVPERVDYEEICLPDILDRTASMFPDSMALLFQGYQVTFSQLKEMVDRFATALVEFGINKGDIVAIVLPNIIPCVVAYYAILKVGAIAVMNNPLYVDRELIYQLVDSEAKVVITLDLLGNRIIDLLPQTGIKQIVYTSIGDYLPFPKNLLFCLFGKRKKLAAPVKSAPNVYKWKKLIAATPLNPPQVMLSFNDAAMYQYTCGTTGVAKGAILTHGNLSKQVQQLAAWLPGFGKGEEIVLGALPFFHIFGLSSAMNLSVYQGWGNILVPKPQAVPLLEAIRKFKPSVAPLVPTMFIGMLNHPDIKKTDMTCLKGCISGSAPLAVEVIRDFEKITGATIVEGYGLTEASPVTHINPFIGRRKIGSIGIPIPDVDCKVVDVETGEKEVPAGERGELAVKGPQVMKEYRNMPEETALALKDGWLYTGDIATMDEDGYFYIVDRKKDVIICGGCNVCPRDIDEVFYENPKVQEACAVGIPHPSRGEAVKVFVVLKEGETARADEMIELCKGKLATYKLPTEIEFCTELPKSSVGKILRKELRAEEMKKRIT
jgi:long-chain acyl-CoA synthetase